ELGELGGAGDGEVEQLVELVTLEGLALGGALDLDETAGPGDDDVHVRLGRDVLDVGQVEDGLPVDDADGDGGDGVGEHRRRALGDRTVGDPPGDGVGEGDVGAGDGGRAGAAVGLQDVAVEDDRVLAERADVDDRAQG